MSALKTLPQVIVEKPIESIDDPVLTVRYEPHSPSLTIRALIRSLASANDPPFAVSVHKPPSVEQLSRRMQLREKRALLLRLTRAPGRFFDTTPVGRILNRFTTDINTIDGAVYNSARFCLTGVLNFLASFLTILIIVPSFAPFALFIAWLYVRLAPRYIRASRDLRRLESVSLSPAFAGFDELMRGITHVRAFGMERRYQEAFYKKVDKFQAFDHVYVRTWFLD